MARACLGHRAGHDRDHPGHCGNGVGVGADLHVAVESDLRVRGGDATPGEFRAGDLSDQERRFRSHDDGVGDRAHLEHEPRLAVGGRGADREPLALPDGERGGALVRTEGVAVTVQDVAGRRRHPLSQPASGVAVRNEADVVGVRLVGDRETALRGFGAHLGLGRRGAEREHRVRELVLGEHTQHVGLVLGPGAGAVQFAVAVGIRHDRGVVTGGDGVEAEVEGLFEQGGELDPLVAAHAGVRGAAGGVFGDEVVDHVELEAFGEVPNVVRDADDVGGPLGIHRVLDGAAAAAAGAQGAGHAAEGQVHPDHLVPRLDHACCGDGGIDPTAHCCQNLHPSSVIG